MGIHRGGGDALVAEQGLDVHQFRARVEQVRGVSMPQLVRANFLLDPGLLQPPPQVGAASVDPLLCPPEISAQFLALTVFPGPHLLRSESAYGRRFGIETT